MTIINSFKNVSINSSISKTTWTVYIVYLQGPEDMSSGTCCLLIAIHIIHFACCNVGVGSFPKLAAEWVCGVKFDIAVAH